MKRQYDELQKTDPNAEKRYINGTDASLKQAPPHAQESKRHLHRGVDSYVKSQTLQKLYQAQIDLARGTMHIPQRHDEQMCMDCDRKTCELESCANCERKVCRYCSMIRSNTTRCLSCL